MVELINTALMRTVMAAGRLRRRLTEERGQDLLEYALLGGLIAAALTTAAVILALSGGLESMASGISDCIDFSGTGCDVFPTS